MLLPLTSRIQWIGVGGADGEDRAFDVEIVALARAHHDAMRAKPDRLGVMVGRAMLDANLHDLTTSMLAFCVPRNGLKTRSRRQVAATNARCLILARERGYEIHGCHLFFSEPCPEPPTASTDSSNSPSTSFWSGAGVFAPGSSACFSGCFPASTGSACAGGSGGSRRGSARCTRWAAWWSAWAT